MVFILCFPEAYWIQEGVCILGRSLGKHQEGQELRQDSKVSQERDCWHQQEPGSCSGLSSDGAYLREEVICRPTLSTLKFRQV